MMAHRILQYVRKIGLAFEKLFQSTLLPRFGCLFVLLVGLLAITVPLVHLTPYAFRKLFECIREPLQNTYNQAKGNDPIHD
mgnify:CR=1 FL=1